MKHYRAPRDADAMIDALISLLGVGAILCIVFLVLTLQGCATNEQFWHTDMPGYRAPVSLIRVASAEQLSKACGMPRSDDSACARRMPQECMVYLGPRADACAESHEVNGHCKGKNHKLTYGIVQECAYE
jgi:hypothetical protein